MTQTLSEHFNTLELIGMFENYKACQERVFYNLALDQDERTKAASIIVKCDDRLRELRG